MDFLKRPLLTIALLLLAVFINDYILENFMFPGNQFGWISGLFCTVEIIFLSYCITMVVSLKGLFQFFRFLFSKNADKELNLVDPQTVTWPIIVAAILYGLFAGIILFFATKGEDFLMSMLQGLVLSFVWGMVYRYFWKRGDLLWLVDWLYVDEDEAGFEPEEEKDKNKKDNWD